MATNESTAQKAAEKSPQKIRNGKTLNAKRQEKAAEDAAKLAAEQREVAKDADRKAAAQEVARLQKAENERRKKKTRHDGDIQIDVVLTMPDGVKHKDEITIKNPRGCIHPTNLLNPGYIMMAVKQQMASRFGRAHIK